MAKLTVHVVDWPPVTMSLLVEGIARAAEKSGTTPAALPGVAALAEPEFLVEGEATAVLD